MGPNPKKRPRRQYVKYRLRVLKELHIDPPPDDVVAKMLDESQMSEIQVDNIFLTYIHAKR